MTVQETVFEGVQAVELTTPKVRLVAVTAYGPRIAFFGRPDGPNLLLWSPEEYTRGDWDLRGGHRVWMTTPGADECEDTYAPDNAPCEFSLAEDGFVITGGESSMNRTCRGIAVSALGEDMVEVDNFVLNTGEMLYSGGVWALTCTVPGAGTRYAVPVGDGSTWDNVTLVLFKEWAGHGQGGLNDPQFAMQEDTLLLTPQGRENKRMVQSHDGIIAMSHPEQDVTFAKWADYDPAGQYPLNTNIACYVGPDNFMVEMETMGPEQTLKPGDELHHSETWVLKDGAVDPTRAETLRQLFAGE